MIRAFSTVSLVVRVPNAFCACVNWRELTLTEILVAAVVATSFQTDRERRPTPVKARALTVPQRAARVRECDARSASVCSFPRT
jgi:hypothetical protein